MRRAVSPALFVVVVICFFLPFVTIACAESSQELAGQLGAEFGATPPPIGEGTDEIASFTGWQLVTGDTGEVEEAADGDTGLPTEELGIPEPTGQIKDSQPLAIAGLAIAVLGIALSWLALWIGPVAGSVLGIAGVVALFLLKGSVEGAVSTAGAGAFFGQLIEFRWQIWFWIAMAAFGLAAGWSLFRLLSEARMRGASSAPGTAAAPAAGGPPPPPGASAPQTPPPTSESPPTPPPPPD